MKTTQIRKAIREEIKKILREEDYTPNYTHMRPFKADIVKMINELNGLNSKIEAKGPLSEEIADAVDILQELIVKLRKG